VETAQSADGTTIAFDRTGGGPPLVLIGGAMSTRAAAADLASHLDGDLAVVRYDRRGRGDSTDRAPYAVEREIEDLDALLRVVGGTAFVYGHSSGAVLGLRAAEAGLAISRLALYEPPFMIDDTRELPPVDYVERLQALVAAGRRGDAVEYFLRVAVQVPASAIAGMQASPVWPALEAVAHTIAYDATIMGDLVHGSPDPLRHWASLATRTLVLDGGASPPWLHNGARALAETLPNAEYRTLAGQDHGPASAVLAPTLTAFFVGGG
jgi:pimeloyl-ACP methyl ester carboxylesterase